MNYFSEILENFLLNFQQSIMSGYDMMRGNKHTIVYLSNFPNKLFSTPEGKKLLDKNPEFINRYEDAFKVAIRIVVATTELNDIMSEMERFIIFDTFKMVFVAIQNPRILHLVKKYLSSIRKRDEDDALFILFDSYFKIITKYVSPINYQVSTGELILSTFERWIELWNKKNSEHIGLTDMDAPMAQQLNILIYQITSFYEIEEHNQSSLKLIKSMVEVMAAILRSKDKKEAKILLKKVKSGLSEALHKF